MLGLQGALVFVGVPAAYAVMAPLEEIWDPVTHRTNIEVQVQVEQAARAPGVAPRR